MTAPFATGAHLRGQDALAGVDALVTDRYLEMLLVAAERGASAAPADTALDGDLREATDVLRRVLLRVHPSFRFEERLAARLADQADGIRENRSGNLIAFRPRATADAVATDPLLAAILDGTLDPADAVALASADGVRSRTRPLIVGGALTSAAVSLVGVALVAWRASHTNARTAASGAGGPA